jgi:hypothetical protein
MKNIFVLFLLLLISFSFRVFTQTSRLKDYICAVSASYQNSMATGSGIVLLDSAGNNYILTNHHVVESSTSLRVIFFSDDGRTGEYTGMRVIARDVAYDLAILSFAGGQRVFSEGLKLNLKEPAERINVCAAGFPNSRWGYSEGSLLSRSVMLRSSDQQVQSFLMHSALVDHGSSGGALLVTDSDTTIGYSVIGVNTLKSSGGRAYSVPVTRVMELLESAAGYFHENYITESNHSRERAVACGFDKPLYSSICSSDEEDWYCFTADVECLVAELEASDNLVIEVYNKQGALINSCSGKTVRLNIRTDPGSVYLRVRGGGVKYWSTYCLMIIEDIDETGVIPAD